MKVFGEGLGKSVQQVQRNYRSSGSSFALSGFGKKRNSKVLRPGSFQQKQAKEYTLLLPIALMQLQL